MGSIVIVGGGIVGTSLAYHLRDTHHDVTLLERRRLGAGTTGKSIACFGWYPLSAGPQHRLVARSWDVYGPLVERGTLSYHRNGLLEAAETQATLEELKTSAEELRDRGIPAEVLAPRELREHNVDPGAASAGAVFYPSVGRLDPAELVSHFAGKARECGVSVETGVEVTDVFIEGGAVAGVETTVGELAADDVVDAAGPWAPALGSMAGVSLPLKRTFAPIGVLDPAETFDLPTVILEDGLYFTGERSATVLAGYAPHEASEADPWEAAPGIESPDEHQGTGIGSVGERHRELVAEKAPRVIPKLRGADLVNEWRGLRCVTPDGRPIVGPTPLEGFWVATGMSGWGITLGPACAELLAERLATGTEPRELSSLRPGRFDVDAHRDYRRSA